MGHIAAEGFLALKLIWTNDANQLGGGVVEKGVRHFERMGAERENLFPPYILLEMVEGVADAIGQDHSDVPWKMHLFTRLDRSFADQDEILRQIRLLYHNQALAAQTQWAFQRPQLGRGYQLPSGMVKDTKTNHYVQEGIMLATRVA